MDESLIMEIWDTFREYIPTKYRDTAANQYVDFLIGKDVDTSTLEGFIGFDTFLDEAIKSVLVDTDTQSDEDYSEDDDE